MAQLTKELENCIRICFDCAKVCGECEKVCITSGSKEMADCALACQDCLEGCLAVVAVLARQSDRYPAALVYCAELSEACAVLCDDFDDPLMKRCAQMCRECATECRRLAGGRRTAAATEQPTIEAH